MLSVLLTMDYEIHGNGEGSPHALMVEPTDRLLRLLDAHGAKLTIMADAAEILRFREYRDANGRDTFHYEAIAEQLRRTVATGHDVQLHLHSSYFRATATPARWEQDWSEYHFAGLPFERMCAMVAAGKLYLESLLRPVDPGYRCVAFRAANWSMQPSDNAVRALLANGILVDTSVFPHGRRAGRVSFDYTRAPSPVVPWPVEPSDICRRNDAGRLWEVPIYSEARWLGAFLAPGRLARALEGRRHRHAEADRTAASAPARHTGWARWPAWLLKRHAWKADFNQCTASQLIAALDRADRLYGDKEARLPFNVIGHSKLFSPRNERALAAFLAHASRHTGRYGFERLSNFVPAQRGGLAT
jgi:hypothetical protein